VLIAAGLRVGVAIDRLQCPFGILELHFLLLPFAYLLLPLPLVGGCAILARLLLHLFAELFRELLDLLALRHGMPRGVMYQALRTALVTVGQLAGALVASLATPAPIRRYGDSRRGGCPASDWLPPAFFFLPLPPTPCAEVPALGLLASLLFGAAGECHAQPSAALAHLSARLNNAETSWTSWVATFSSIFSSRTPWRNATTTEALEI
jgi:hypothetical protein